MPTSSRQVVPPAGDDANTIEQADVAIAREAGRYRKHPVVRTMGAISELADQPPLIAICAATLGAGLLTRRPRLALAGARMLSAHLAATAVKTVIKRQVDRTRPKLLVDENRYERGSGERYEGDYNSFPSGHTAGAVAVARAVTRTYPNAAPAAGLLAAMVALVQIPRCAHYLSDITAGAAIGWAAEAITERAFRLGT